MKKINTKNFILSLSLIGILILFISFFIISGDDGDNNSPLQVTWAQEGKTIKFVWAENNDDTESYKLYRGISSGQYGESIETEGSNNFLVLDISSLSERKYYFAVSALDAAGNESEKSRELVVDLSVSNECGNGIIEDGEICDSDVRLCEASNGGWGEQYCDNCSNYFKECVTLGNNLDCENEVVDKDGNKYETVKIGNQCWMAENINVGTMLASGSTEPNTGDAVIEKWCSEDSVRNCGYYGGLYSWNEAMRGSDVPGSQGICMDGWHIPTDQELNILENYVIDYIDSSNPQYPCSTNETGWQRCADDDGSRSGGTYGAGKSLKATSEGGTDDVGFNGISAGYHHTNGSYYGLDFGLWLWSSTSSSSSYAFRRIIATSNYSTVFRNSSEQGLAYSIRCLKD